MLNRVLERIRNSSGPINLNELSHEFGIEPTALEGMLSYCARKGRLACDAVILPDGNCSGQTPDRTRGTCGANCFGLEACPFVVNLPKTYTVIKIKDLD